MKTFREKLFDIMIGVFVVLVLTAVVTHFFFPRVARRLTAGEPVYRQVQIQLVSQNLILADKIAAGDAQTGLDGDEKAVLESFEIKQYKDILGPKFANFPFVQDYYIMAAIKVNARVLEDGTLRLGPYIMKPGDIFPFNTDKYMLWGTILTVIKN
ncbi:MAG: hypothetical protein HZA48_02780 [Planctomycetes bacterium]|nr:hypothetical protein [Planctomycetota bacterium]